MTSLHYINRAFDRASEAAVFHPIQGHSWTTDERTRSDLATAEEAHQANAMRMGIDQVLVDCFHERRKVEEKKRVDYSLVTAKVVGNVSEPSKVPPLGKRKKKDGEPSSKRKKET